jgi:putative sterol carrier protein
MMEPTAEELVAAMHQAVQETPSLKSRFNASVEFRFDDVKERVDVSKKTKSEQEPPDLVVTTSLPVFHQLLNKKLTPQQAFMQGKLKIKGKVGNLNSIEMYLKFKLMQLIALLLCLKLMSDGFGHETELGAECNPKGSATKARKLEIQAIATIDVNVVMKIHKRVAKSTLHLTVVGKWQAVDATLAVQ